MITKAVAGEHSAVVPSDNLFVRYLEQRLKDHSKPVAAVAILSGRGCLSDGVTSPLYRFNHAKRLPDAPPETLDDLSGCSAEGVPL